MTAPPIVTPPDQLDEEDRPPAEVRPIGAGRLRRLPPPPVAPPEVARPAPVRDTRPHPAVGDAPPDGASLPDGASHPDGTSLLDGASPLAAVDALAVEAPAVEVAAAVEMQVPTPVPGRVRRLLVRRTVVVDGDAASSLAAAEPAGLRSLSRPRFVPPRAALSLVWAAVLVIGLAAGPVILALIAAPVAFVATASALRFGRRAPGERATSTDPLVPADFRMWLAAAVALVPLGALGGPVVALVLAGVVAGLAVYLSARQGYPRHSVLVLTLAPALAAGSLVLARRQEGLTVAFVLVAAVLLYDGASCLMGTGSTGGRAGFLAGLATVFVFGFFVSAAADPPFGGVAPWLLCIVVGVLAGLATRVLNRYVRPGRAPALRRLDSLAVAGPVWVLIVLIGFH